MNFRVFSSSLRIYLLPFDWQTVRLSANFLQIRLGLKWESFHRDHMRKKMIRLDGKWNEIRYDFSTDLDPFIDLHFGSYGDIFSLVIINFINSIEFRRKWEIWQVWQADKGIISSTHWKNTSFVRWLRVFKCERRKMKGKWFSFTPKIFFKREGNEKLKTIILKEITARPLIASVSLIRDKFYKRRRVVVVFRLLVVIDPHENFQFLCFLTKVLKLKRNHRIREQSISSLVSRENYSTATTKITSNEGDKF